MDDADRTAMQYVSIRVRSRERTMRCCSTGFAGGSGFNPRPLSRADDRMQSVGRAAADACFNPRPLSRADDMRVRGLPMRIVRFQSASALASGRFEDVSIRWIRTLKFQSASALASGRLMVTSAIELTSCCFNPRPLSRADDDTHDDSHGRPTHVFQSASALASGRYRQI